jgi:exodeoxyribonuclease VII small subunit
MSEKSGSSKKEVPFEKALERLEKLVTDLEGGDLALEESLRKFEEGVKLARLCSDRLQAAELRISQLEESADGTRERPLSVEED